MTDDRVQMLGFSVSNCTEAELLASWTALRFLFPVNVDVLMKLHRHETFARAVKAAGSHVTLVNDSRVLALASRFILGQRFRSTVSGSDFLPAFCVSSHTYGARVFLLGGLGDVAERARAHLNRMAGREVVVAARSPSFGFDRNPTECADIVHHIRSSGANVLAVGVGAPKQELWMLQHAAELSGVRVFMAVGATIDFLAGNVRRAPRWLSNSGLEWLYRLVREPRRLARRYLIEGPPVFWLLLRQRLSAGPR